jgi:hypothetical protein
MYLLEEESIKMYGCNWMDVVGGFMKSSLKTGSAVGAYCKAEGWLANGFTKDPE